MATTASAAAASLVRTKISLPWAALVWADSAWACFDCRKAVEAQVYGADFFANLLALGLPLAILAAIGFGFYFSDVIADKLRKEKRHDQ
jgi:hypothetical protein